MLTLVALAHARSDFETQLGKRGPFLQSMMMGDGNEAYFPEGAADRRVLLELIGGEGPRLVYQKVHGRKATTEWALHLVSKRGHQPMSGTLRRMLWQRNFSIAVPRLTRCERDALDANKSFAIYTVYGPDQWIAASTLSTDGREGPWDVYSSYPRQAAGGWATFRPIVAEEVRALRLGNERWHGPGPLSFSHGTTAQEAASAMTVWRR